ncbi:hypothetical protein AC739_15185 [Planococcus glaciei]|uniref:hypothetical protein n=1 Tax=Planococcus glaciei TaxID=459472 RepID=UPI00069CF154|nr:hypothetical protein [Planococcus glaciei]KOF09463.1 hypothetical protein AC739_15185 [Planococcus glaciei]
MIDSNKQTDESVEKVIAPKKDSKSRKYLLTINNPTKDMITHESIQEILATKFKSLLYACMSDEVASQHHKHVFLAFSSPVRFSQIKKYFPSAHIDKSRGTAENNRHYVFKEGKWADTNKAETNLKETHWEWGEIPNERSGNRTDLAELYELIQDGFSNAEIIEQNPDNILFLQHIDRTRKAILEEKFKSNWRNLDVTYIFGPTGTGKSRHVMEKYGYENVFRITDYLHPFDSYRQQDVIVFEEFTSSLKIQDMLNYLDGYPLELPSRYSNKQATFTKVYILSNSPLRKQYETVQIEKIEVWRAFLRRIKKVLLFDKQGTHKEFTTDEFLHWTAPANILAEKFGISKLIK